MNRLKEVHTSQKKFNNNAKTKSVPFYRRFWVKVPVHSEHFSAEKGYLFHNTRHVCVCVFYHSLLFLFFSAQLSRICFFALMDPLKQRWSQLSPLSVPGYVPCVLCIEPAIGTLEAA